MKAGGRLTAKSIAEKRTCTFEIQPGIFSRLSIRVHVHVLILRNYYLRWTICMRYLIVLASHFPELTHEESLENSAGVSEGRGRYQRSSTDRL